MQSKALLSRPSIATLRSRIAELEAASAPSTAPGMSAAAPPAPREGWLAGRGRARASRPAPALLRAHRRAGGVADGGLAAGHRGPAARTLQPRPRTPGRSASAPSRSPSAYRVFFRQIGLDPDVERTPVEAAMLERMLRGGFLTGGLLDDVLLISLMDTGVPRLGARHGDARRPAGDPRRASRGSRSGARGTRRCCRRAGSSWPTLATPLAPLFGECAPGHRARAGGRGC